MDEKELQEYVNQQRWLINNGLISDSIKNQLFFCGSIVHKDVLGVELSINVEKFICEYVIYLPKEVLAKVETYKRLSTSTSLFGMWKFKRFLQKEGSMDFDAILKKCINDFLGSKWSASIELKNFSDYVDTLGEPSEPGDSQYSDQ